jgi:hypothetical protein
MRPGPDWGDPAFPATVLDVLANVLRRADSPAKAGAYLTEEIRELTGARCVLLLESRADTPDGPAVVSVNPGRRRDWARAPGVRRMLEAGRAAEVSRPWRLDDDSEVAGFLRREDCNCSLVVPLSVGSASVGSLLVLGLPDEDHVGDVQMLLTKPRCRLPVVL